MRLRALIESVVVLVPFRRRPCVSDNIPYAPATDIEEIATFYLCADDFESDPQGTPTMERFSGAQQALQDMIAKNPSILLYNTETGIQRKVMDRSKQFNHPKMGDIGAFRLHAC